jgi:hypothetical protein
MLVAGACTMGRWGDQSLSRLRPVDYLRYVTGLLGLQRKIF